MGVTAAWYVFDIHIAFFVFFLFFFYESIQGNLVSSNRNSNCRY